MIITHCFAQLFQLFRPYSIHRYTIVCTHNTSGRLYSRQFCRSEYILYSLICMVKTNKQTNKTLWQSSGVRCYPVCVSAIFFISASLLVMSYCWGCACLTHSHHIVLSTRDWCLIVHVMSVSHNLITSSSLFVMSYCSCYVCLSQSHHIVVSIRDWCLIALSWFFVLSL